MSTLEDGLRMALDRQARQYTAIPGDWQGLQSRLTQPRRGGWLPAVAAAAVLIAVVVLTVVLIRPTGVQPADGTDPRCRQDPQQLQIANPGMSGAAVLVDVVQSAGRPDAVCLWHGQQEWSAPITDAGDFPAAAVVRFRGSLGMISWIVAVAADPVTRVRVVVGGDQPTDYATNGGQFLHIHGHAVLVVGSLATAVTLQGIRPDGSTGNALSLPTETATGPTPAPSGVTDATTTATEAPVPGPS